MIKISEQDAAFLREHLEDADNLMRKENFDELLDVLDDFITDNFDLNYNLNDIGTQAERIYDRIYYANSPRIN